jgi:hypothetical protein
MKIFGNINENNKLIRYLIIVYQKLTIYILFFIYITCSFIILKTSILYKVQSLELQTNKIKKKNN